ncbi:MAG TPA: hypothetical protein VIA18_18500 [Polyangia bacterium]|nr:hypothetical protein [Polyangia bacterium]
MALAWLALPLLLLGCKPNFGAPLSLVTTARLVAVRAEPAEAAPGATVTMTALAASPNGSLAPTVAWSVCTTPKPIAENGAVAASCLADGGTTALADTAAPLPIVLPAAGCSLFGPELPPETAGEMLQPRAPDVTGGYFQPLRADFADASTIGLVRIRCALPGASLAAATAFAAQYTNNVNPTMTAIIASVDGASVALDALPAGRAIVFSAGWTADSPEHYPVFDADTQTLVDHREAMTLSWYATAGAFATERSGRAEDDPALSASDTWTAPRTPGPAHVWVVLEDSRGGIDFADAAIAVVN